MEKVGILGGTFNPVHIGHMKMARGFLNRLKLDRVLLIPDNSPPHKDAPLLPEGEKRLEMCRIACAEETHIEACGIELERPGKSYTVDTLEELSRRCPDAGFYLITGADMFLTLEKWRRFDRIAQLAVLCGCARHEGELAVLEAHKTVLQQKYGARCYVENIPVTEVSSTQIRKALITGSDISELMPSGVIDYILRNNLYK